jgi:hypothetical protein
VLVVVLAALVVALLGAAGGAAAQTGEPGGSGGSGGPLPDSEQVPSDVRQSADDVLSRAEFQHEPSLVDRVLQWIVDRLNELFAVVGGGAGGQSVLGYVVIALLLGLVGFFLYRLVRGGRLGGRRRAEEPVSVTTSGGRIDWAARADQAEADGRWRLGLRCRYRALTDRLVAAQVLDDIPGRTSGEHRREVDRRAPEASAPFGQAADLFDRAWYGNRPTGPAESARFRELADEVLDRAGRPDRRPVDEMDLVAPR